MSTAREPDDNNEEEMQMNEETGAVFNPLELEAGDVDVRRHAIIFVSKNRIKEYETKLIDLLSREVNESNRRHIVRALGNIGSCSSISVLCDIITNSSGLIIGDAIEALGKLKATEAKSYAEQLINSPIDWVANKARWTFRRLNQAEKEKGT